MNDYSIDYYKDNAQDKDRPALWFYNRLINKFSKGNCVLDFGCGVGFLSKHLSKKNHVFAYEKSRKIRKRIRKNAPNAVIVDRLKLLEDQSLDFIVALHVLEHISDKDLNVIGYEFKRLLSSSGRMLFVMPNPQGKAAILKGSHWAGFRDDSHINLKNDVEWRNFFEKNWGAEVIWACSDGYYDGLYSQNIFSRVFCDSIRAAKTLVQFLLARPLLQANDGEATIFLLEFK